MFRLRCPATAFKYCARKLLIRTTGKVATRIGKRQLVVAARRFLLPPATDRTIGVRVRAGVAPFIKRGGMAVRARISVQPAPALTPRSPAPAKPREARGLKSPAAPSSPPRGTAEAGRQRLGLFCRPQAPLRTQQE